MRRLKSRQRRAIYIYTSSFHQLDHPGGGATENFYGLLVTVLMSFASLSLSLSLRIVLWRKSSSAIWYNQQQQILQKGRRHWSILWRGQASLLWNDWTQMNRLKGERKKKKKLHPKKKPLQVSSSYQMPSFSHPQCFMDILRKWYNLNGVNQDPKK